MTDGRDPMTPAADKPTESSPDQPDDAPSGRRPSAGAQAASRARRIGGRPSPGPRPSPRETAEPEERATPTDADSPAPTRPMRPGRSARASAPVATKPAAEESRTTADAERLRREIERLRWIPAIVAGVVAVTVLVLCVWQSHGVWWGKQRDNRNQVRQEVLAAAKPCVAAIVSYDYRNLAASEKAGRACITGAFKADYTKAMETTVRTLAPQSKTVQVFQIAKAGIEQVSADGKQWVVLLYGQQQVTNSTTAKKQPRLDILNVEATLTKVGKKWLVSSIR